MKHLLIYVIFVFIPFLTFAQVQQGYVKTIGRPNMPGTSLEGVTVRVTGSLNTVISNPQGNFSFPISNQRFKFSRISKKGFELADKDLLRYDFGYSPDAPIILVMVSREELQRERELIEEQSRKKLDLRFQKQNIILEKKLERNLLSEEEFKKQLLALKEKFDNIDTLVSTLAERYARTDYDNIDSVRVLINKCIENGELEKAQQLIYSKGSLDERTKKLEETRKLRLQAQMRESRLQQDLATDLLQLHQIALSQKKYDSAYIYLEKRYLTDTTQVVYLWDLVKAYFPRWSFPRSERKERDCKHEAYLLNLYNRLQKTEVASVLNTDVYVASATMEFELGNFYRFIDEDEKAVFYYRKMLNTLKDRKMDLEYIPLQALGSIYLSQNKYVEAFSAYQEALDYCKKADIKIKIQLKLADICCLKGDVDSALKKYVEAEKAYGIPDDSVSWKIEELYVLQKLIATKFQEQGRYKDAIRFYNKAVKNAERYYSLNKATRNMNSIVALLGDLQNLYASQGKYEQMYRCADKALSYVRIYMGRFPSALSRLLYAEVLCQMVNAKAYMKKMATVEQDLVECLKNSEFASNIFKDRYRRLTGCIYHTFAINYLNQGLYKKALNSIEKSIHIEPNDIKAYRSKIAILNAMDKKEESVKVGQKLQKLETETLKQKNKTLIFSDRFDWIPIWNANF